MTKYFTEVVCQAHDIDRQIFDAVVPEIAEALFSLDGGAGASFSADPRAFTVTFGFMFSSRSRKDAIEKSKVIARTALHASGGVTAGWDDEPDGAPEFEPVDFETVSASAQTEREKVAA